MFAGHPFGSPYFGGAAEVPAGGTIKTGAATLTGVSTWTATVLQAGGAPPPRRRRRQLAKPRFARRVIGGALIAGSSSFGAWGARRRDRGGTLSAAGRLEASGNRLPGAPLEEFLILMDA